jgi:uncharacterized coiled-coil DUF342 family protein
MSKELTKPSESLVQELLAERRELKVALERLRLELDDMRSTSRGPDPRVSGLTAEVERLRFQLAHARAEANLMREERDELRHGVEKALEQITRK